ncbi:hypothetical protein FA15DRAFT_754674 [Coprinopsis marcescibilis]|uniref:DUF6533 domain-containing protein n=1 Tax=Coprinopsis marcescibilis TaxID=230819 RepID=A0A5C3L2N2_COPMA|nr:hypothetical protein FA15DRAFT_754674 [Coprinopsis marcescibilis]
MEREYWELVESKRLQHSLQAGLMTFLVADYLETLPWEVEYVWKSKWNLVKVLFLLARYSIFLEVILFVPYQITRSPEFTRQECQAFYIICGMGVILTITFTQAIFFIRVWALSGRSKGMQYYLYAQFFVMHGTQLILGCLVSAWTSVLTGTGLPITQHTGCLFLPRPELGPIISFLFGLFVISSTILVCIMCWFGFRLYRSHPTNLITIIFSDGLLYYFTLAALSTTNTVLNKRIDQSPEILLILIEGEAVLHSVLACRLLLHVRELARTTSPAAWDCSLHLATHLGQEHAPTSS